MDVRLAVALSALCAAAPLAAADPARLSLAELTARAAASERARMADADRDGAAARVDEADAARWAKLTATGFAAPSPEIRCGDPTCATTDPDDFALRFSGAFVGGQLNLTQPLYTFGKLGAARAAARAGRDAQAALADGARGDLAVDAARAYWALKLARELRYMLEDGLERVGAARARLDERLADGDEDVSLADRQRIDVLIAEATIQLADARQGEAQALAAVRALAGDGAVDIDEEPLEAVAQPIAGDDELIARARASRAEVRAARGGADAAARLAELERAGYWPDVAVVGSVGASLAQGVDDPPSAFANDPYNRVTGALALAVRWQIEPWTTRAKVARAEAGRRRADALADLAITGATLDAAAANAEARGAQERLTAATAGEQAARGWLASVVQADAVGTAEAKDLADAYVAWFQMRARVAQAIYQWNVAVARVARAAGEYPAAAHRPTPSPGASR